MLALHIHGSVPGGFKQRIDFVLVPRQCVEGVTESKTLFELECTGLEHDHFANQVSLAFERSSQHAPELVAFWHLPVPEAPPGLP